MNSRSGSERGASITSLSPWQRSRRRQSTLADVQRVVRAADLPARVARATELEAYFAVKQLGASDAAPLLAHLSAEQVRALWDFEAWSGDGLRPSELLVWTQAFREAGPEALVRAFFALDREAAAALLARRLWVALKPKDDETAGPSEGPPLPEWVQDEHIDVAETPDGRFWIAARRSDASDDEPVDEEERKAVLELVAELYRSPDWDDAAGLLRLAEADLPSDLEETALRFRNARLEDLGFPAPDRAREVYAPVDPTVELTRTWQPWGADTTVWLPDRYGAVLEGTPLRTALEAVADVQTFARLESELVPLLHAVLVADRIDPAADAPVREAVARTAGVLMVALQAPDSPWEPAERLRRIPLRMLFRAGHSFLLRLKARADALRKGSIYGLLEASDHGALEVLGARRPWFPEGLEAHPDPVDPARAAVGRPFRGWADVEQVGRWLQDLEGLEAADRAMGLGARIQRLDEPVWPPAPEERTLRRALTTGAAWTLLGEGFGFEPIAAGRLPELADRVPGLQPARVAQAVARELGGRGGLSEGAVQGLVWTLTLGLTALRDELLPAVGQGQVDPRYLDAVLRRPA
jgi:hypothetical protein